MNLVGMDNVKTMLNENFALVKRILLGYPSDYRSKYIKLAGTRQILITPKKPNFGLPSKIRVSHT